jgi:VanZ family protein
MKTPTPQPPPAVAPACRASPAGAVSAARGEGEGEKESLVLPFAPLPLGRGSSLLVLHLFVLLTFLGLWTWKLLEPYPVPEIVSAQLQGEVRFVAAKGLHACGYGFLALLAVTLPVRNEWRWCFAALLALHGVGTEIGQTYVPNRTGSVRDVLIDWAGVALGVLVWQTARWLRRPAS